MYTFIYGSDFSSIFIDLSRNNFVVRTEMLYIYLIVDYKGARRFSDKIDSFTCFFFLVNVNEFRNLELM